jgi:hypothetical protein
MTCDINNPQTAVNAVLLFASIGVLLSSLEWCALFGEFRKGGIYDWDVIRLLHRPASSSYTAGLLAVVSSPCAVAICLAIRIIASAWCICDIVFSQGEHSWLVPCILSLTGLYINYRTYYGLEGSDQMINTVCISLSLGLLAQSERGLVLALYFIAAQSVLSYFVAGVSKLRGSLWRNGQAVRLIVNTRSFGHPYFSRFLSQRPLLALFCTYSVLIIECSFPLSLVLPAPLTFAMIILVTVMHLLNCVVLGFNVFLWAFLATYPAILFTAEHVRSWMTW